MTQSITMRQSNGETFIRIWQGKRWIGRVWRATDGTYGARIGTHAADKQPSADAAFREVGASFFGYADYAGLARAKAQVRAKNREVRAEARHAVAEMYRGNYDPFLEILSRST